jgi:MerR family mercuric resistance operon transcriptional regulator
MSQSAATLTIGTLAQAAEVNVETIRFYQRKGLVQEPDRPQGSIRHYGEPHLARLRFIKSAQRLGFSLVEIAELLTLDDGTHCAPARIQAERKLADVRTRLADLQRIEGALEDLIKRCNASKGKVHCPLIATLQQPLLGEPK